MNPPVPPRLGLPCTETAGSLVQTNVNLQRDGIRPRWKILREILAKNTKLKKPMKHLIKLRERERERKERGRQGGIFKILPLWEHTGNVSCCFFCPEIRALDRILREQRTQSVPNSAARRPGGRPIFCGVILDSWGEALSLRHRCSDVLFEVDKVHINDRTSSERIEEVERGVLKKRTRQQSYTESSTQRVEG